MLLDVGNKASESLPENNRITTFVRLGLLGLAVICTAVAFLVFFQLIAETGPVRATVITYVNPADDPSTKKTP